MPVITERTSSSVILPTTPVELIAAGFLARYPKITRDIYKIHIRQWFIFCEEMGVHPLKVQRIHIEAWARHLDEDLGRKPQTVAGKLNAVCGLYRFATLDEHIDRDPSIQVR